MFKEFNWNYQTYKFWKPFIWMFVLLGVGIGTYSLSLNNFTGNPYYYSSCPPNPSDKPLNAKCFNVFYHSNLCGSEIKNEDILCSQEFIFAGQSLGTKPPWVVSNFYLILFSLALFFIILNHLIFNRTFKFPKMELN